jgi:urease accessory protein
MASEILAPGAANIIQDEINELEKRLQDAKARLYKAQSSPPLTPNRK